MTKASHDRVKPAPQPPCEWRGTGPLVRPPGPKSETRKEFLKAALMRGQRQCLDWKKEVHDFFLARAQEVKKERKGKKVKQKGQEERNDEKVRFQWCLPFAGEVQADKNLLFQKAQELARALREGEEVANKFIRLAARVSVCQDKPDLLAAIARFFPNLKAGTQTALNACDEQWQSWDLPSLKKLFLLTKIFLEAQA
jgi:hypothetical protein